MPATQERVAAETYETGAEVVVRVELPGGLDVDAADAAVSMQDGTLEIRLPRRPAADRGSGRGLLGFHPDAPPS